MNVHPVNLFYLFFNHSLLRSSSLFTACFFHNPQHPLFLMATVLKIPAGDSVKPRSMCMDKCMNIFSLNCVSCTLWFTWFLESHILIDMYLFPLNFVMSSSKSPFNLNSLNIITTKSSCQLQRTYRFYLRCLQWKLVEVLWQGNYTWSKVLLRDFAPDMTKIDWVLSMWS